MTLHYCACSVIKLMCTHMLDAYFLMSGCVLVCAHRWQQQLVRQDGTGDDDREAVLKTVKTYAQLPRENMSERYAHTKKLLLQKLMRLSILAEPRTSLR
jgi:hypothetical protein